MTHYLAQEARQVVNGEVEVDESYFAGVCKRKRGRGVGGKVAVFGLLKHEGNCLYKNCFQHKDKSINVYNYC